MITEPRCNAADVHLKSEHTQHVFTAHEYCTGAQCTGGEADIHSTGTKVTTLWPSLNKQTHEMYVTLRPFFLQNICASQCFFFYSAAGSICYIVVYRYNIA